MHFRSLGDFCCFVYLSLSLFCFYCSSSNEFLKIKVGGGAITNNNEASLAEAGREGWTPVSWPLHPPRKLLHGLNPRVVPENTLWNHLTRSRFAKLQAFKYQLMIFARFSIYYMLFIHSFIHSTKICWDPVLCWGLHKNRAPLLQGGDYILESYISWCKVQTLNSDRSGLSGFRQFRTMNFSKLYNFSLLQLGFL